MARFPKTDVTMTQDLSAGAGTALSGTTSIGKNFKLTEVTLRASVNITETVTITRDAKAGAAYDVVLAKRALIAEKDFVFRPQGECLFLNGDEVKVECTAANDTGAVYVVVKTAEVNN